MAETLLTVREVAALTQLHEITIRRYIADGKLDAVRIGRRIRVPRRALTQLLKPVMPTGTDRSARSVMEPAVAYGAEVVSVGDLAGSDKENRERSNDVDSLWDIVGMFDSGLGDLAEKHDDYLVQTIGDEHQS